MIKKQENLMPLFVSNKLNKLKNYSPHYLKMIKILFSSTHLERKTRLLEEHKLMNVTSILKISKLISLQNNLKNSSLNMETLLVLNSLTQTLNLKNQIPKQPNMVLSSTKKLKKLFLLYPITQRT